MIHQGHVRVGGAKRTPDAVQWWYVRIYDDGWVFARGGRVRTTRDARRMLREAVDMCAHERSAFDSRPSHTLQPDGSIVPIQRSPYEAVK